MDVRRWSMDQILMLPDHCFGRRFSVCASVVSVSAARVWDISEIALPEKCVLWEVVISTSAAYFSVELDSVRIALGDQLPTTEAMMDALEPLVPGLGDQGVEPRYIRGILGRVTFHLRNPISAMGRRLVLEVRTRADKTVTGQVICEFSSIPKEVPDCLLSV